MCTTSRTKKVIVGLALVAVTVGCMFAQQHHLLFSHYVTLVIFEVVDFAFFVVVPVTVLVINAILIREVRRAANNAAANLGLQQHHQSTSSSAVPTVMLVTTSIVYVLLLGTASISWYAYKLTHSYFLYNCHVILAGLSFLVYAYNFFVYLITGKQFRSELRTLFCRSSTSSSSAAAVVVYDRNDARLAAHGQADTAV